MHRVSLYTPQHLVTLLRLVCTPVFLFCCAQALATLAAWARWGALGLFVIIVGSDMADGWLARRLGQASVLGRALDHGCDVVFLLVALGFFATHGLVPWVLPAAIVWAFGLYMLDSWWRTAGHAQRQLLSSRLGHLSGMLNYAAVGIVTINVAAGTPLVPPALVRGGCLGLACLGLISGGERLWLLCVGLYHRRRRLPQGRRQKTQANHTVQEHKSDMRHQAIRQQARGVPIGRKKVDPGSL